MQIQTISKLLTTILVVTGLALMPAMAFAGVDDEPVDDDEPAVTIDDMTTSADTAESTDGEVYAAEGSSGTNWAVIVGRNALWGGITGALVGTGLYLITGMDWSPWVIAQFAGGGILVGATVGLISAATQADSGTRALERPASVDWVTRDLPRTYELDVIQFDF